MTLKVKDFTNFIEQFAPLGSQEDYDNSGLIIGNEKMEVSGILLSLDCLEATVDEAISLNANLIIVHHPIIFKGLKKINGKNYVERTIIKSIQNNIAIYAVHTNLDNYKFGVNYEIANRLGLPNPEILSPSSNSLKKLVFFVPTDYAEKVSKAIFDAGGGNIGNYSQCSFESIGTGAFLPNEFANPTIGVSGKREKVKEKRIEILVSNHLEHRVVQAMKSTHPYEEVSYELYPISNKNQNEGAGMVGFLKEKIEVKDFFKHIKNTFNCGVIRHTEITSKWIEKVAFCGGSGSFLLSSAISQKADIYITSDFKYHEFFDADGRIIVADIGHFESEQFTPNLILTLLKKKFINFALYLSKVNTNPINYF